MTCLWPFVDCACGRGEWRCVGSCDHSMCGVWLAMACLANALLTLHTRPSCTLHENLCPLLCVAPWCGAWCGADWSMVRIGSTTLYAKFKASHAQLGHPGPKQERMSKAGIKVKLPKASKKTEPRCIMWPVLCLQFTLPFYSTLYCTVCRRSDSRTWTQEASLSHNMNIMVGYLLLTIYI